MSRVVHEFVRFDTLPAPRRAALAAEVRAFLPRVFDGLEPARLEALIAGFQSLDLLRTESGELVGVNSLRFVDVRPPGFDRPVSVLNHLAGILPEYRGGNSVIRYLVREGFRHWFSRGCRPFYYCCRFIHPSPYRLFVNLGSQPFPAPHDHESQHMNALLGELGAALGYELETNDAGLHVTRPAFRVKAEAAGAARYAETDAVTQFFEQQVPRYREGQGLLVVMPLGVRAAFEVPARLAWRRFTRGLRRCQIGANLAKGKSPVG